MSDTQATAQNKVGTPDHLESRKAKCGQCGVVYYFDGPHVCPQPSQPTKTYADGLREAAEIARTVPVSFTRVETSIRSGETVLSSIEHRPIRAAIAAAIEAKAGEK